MSRIRLADERYIREQLQKDLQILRQNYQEKKRAKEEELLPSVDEAIAYCEAQLAKKEGELCSDEDEPSFVPLQELNKAKSAMAALNQKKVEVD